MDEAEQRQILEDIARNEDNYPRDRIAAVRALREIDKAAANSLENELGGLIATN
jgi:plasmid stability protein